MAVVSPAAGHLPARRSAVGTVALRIAPEAGVLAVAALLRLSALGGVPTNPYYDAAVRSMGSSWAAFLSGAFEPGRRVAIDKPPIDLWLQVASTRLFGFGAVGLLLPEALGGVALVAAVMWLLRGLFGRWAAVAGGLALAVLPSAVVVARSDTMDAVMAALATAGIALVVRAARGGRLAPLVGAGALLGLAFNVKLAESLVPALAAVALWLLAGRRRARGLAVGGAAFVVVALAWLVAVTLVPLHPRPWSLGSTNGSPWNSALVYNGLDRLTGHANVRDVTLGSNVTDVHAANVHGVPLGADTTDVRGGAAAPPGVAPSRTAASHAAALARRASEHAAALERRPGPAGPLRLLSTQAHLLTWIGIEATAALAALAAALSLGAHRRLDRIGRKGLLALGLWLAAGLALTSAMPDLRPRYLACVDPAVAATLGAGIALAAERRGRAIAAVALAAILAIPTATSIAAVVDHTQDAGRTGALPQARVDALAAYLNRAGAANELAASAPAKAGQLIASQGHPVLILSDGQGRQLVTPRELANDVARGTIRFALLGDACTATSGNARTGCLPVVRWAHAHGVDVSRAAGQPRPGALYELAPRGIQLRGRNRGPASGRSTQPVGAAAATGRTPTSARSRRTAPAADRSASRRASRARRHRGERARHGSRRRSGARRSHARRRPA
jgi:4-amino-4-deoxy-L-arabinose transferase-like glycosyltransferase